MKSPGWIKLHRSLIDWEWYEDTNCVRLLIHLLLTVNYEHKKWKGQYIKSGTRITSWETLSNELSMSTRRVRTAMSKLERSGEVTRKTTNKWQAVTLVKWEELQQDKPKHDKPETDKRQTNDKPETTTKERKEIKKEKNFSLFWSKYPKKVAKDKCKDKFLKLKESEIETILNTIDKYINYKPFEDYTHPNPLTYLNQRRWEDEIPEEEKKPKTGAEIYAQNVMRQINANK